ncbi:MAG: hypothetical protein Q9164_003557 [Protoblastenia rupestris]
MDESQTALLLAYANSLHHKAPDTRPPVYKAIGISLAIASGVFIGTSFVLKKMGLLKANVKYNEEAGEGYGYLKNAFWWTGMTLMIIGEIFNFVAYAFVDAILVTPLGALSVVIATILSAIFLKERLSFVGKVGCFMCIIGSIVIVMNAPHQSSAATIQDMKKFVLAPGFLSYAGVIIVGCTFVALWVGPRYGKKSMLVYLSICSLIGGLSVVCTQGLGAAVVTQASGKQNQFNQWFLYVLFVFVVATLVTEIIYLNKALNLFNAALVTPTYYVYFTSSTIITSTILFQGFKGTPTSIITVVMGFLVICSGVVLLQLSKSAKDVPDAAVFKGDLDQVRTVAEQEEPETEPKGDAIRGTAAIIRSFSTSRQKMEAAEVKRVHEDRMRDQMEPIGEDEQVEWDGLRRRKTLRNGPGSLSRSKTLHPPLGMARFPDDWEDTVSRPASTDVHGGGVFHGGIFNSFRRNKRNDSVPPHSQTAYAGSSTNPTDFPQRNYTQISVRPKGDEDTSYHPPSSDGAMEMDHIYGLPGPLQRSPSSQERQHNKPIAWAASVSDRPSASRDSSNTLAAPTPPRHQAKRQFSFQNVFHRNRGNTVSSTDSAGEQERPSSRLGLGSRQGGHKEHPTTPGLKSATEEERLGLVKGDSNALIPSPEPEYSDREEEYDWTLERKGRPLSGGHGTSDIPLIREEKEVESRRESPERGARGEHMDVPRILYPDERGGSKSSGTGPAFI